MRQDLRELCESGGVRPVRTALIQLGVTMVPFPQESAFAKVPPYGGAVQVPRIVQLPQRVGVTYAGPAGFKYLSRNKLNCRARTEDVTRDG